MHARERIIRTRFTEHECANCGSHYQPSSVVVLARRRTAWMVMVSCPSCDRRALFVVTFPELAQPNAEPLSAKPFSFEDPGAFPHTFLPLPSDFELTPDSSSDLPLAPPSPAASQHPESPVSTGDVDAMREFLARFDGDFNALFTPRRRTRMDD